MAAIEFDQLNILVVDDDHHMLKLVATIIRSQGARKVYQALDVKEAQRELQLNEIDIAIVDWEMEPVSGLDLVRQIRRGDDSLNPYLPIIMLTNHASREKVLEARDSGVHDFLGKPVSPLAIHGRICAVLGEQRSFIRSGEYFGPDRRRRSLAMEGDDRRTTEPVFESPKAPEAKTDSTAEPGTTATPGDMARAAGAKG